MSGAVAAERPWTARRTAWRAAWRRLASDRRLLLELFVVSNLAFLVLDVWIAHSVNAFRDPLEWVPVVFAAAGSIALAAVLAAGRGGRAGERDGRIWRWTGFAVGWAAIAVGVWGLLLHLESRFFREATLDSLVYSAPFAAPLAFAGLGFLLLLDRMVPPRSVEHARWVVFLALGGFVGNFALSLADHAQNGFFHAAEWLSVAAAAFAVAFLALVVARPGDRGLRRACYAVLAFQVVVGVAGFALHLAAAARGPAGLLDDVLYGAPVFAPLLFADLAALGGLGLWELEDAVGAAGTGLVT